MRASRITALIDLVIGVALVIWFFVADKSAWSAWRWGYEVVSFLVGCSFVQSAREEFRSAASIDRGARR